MRAKLHSVVRPGVGGNKKKKFKREGENGRGCPLPVRLDGTDSKIPADLRPLATAKQLGMPDWRREQQLLQVAKETFK
jgi:hypothetical protein